MYSWSTTFSDLFTRCRYLIVIVIPEGSYLLGWKACSSYPDAVSDYVCISSLYRIIELNWIEFFWKKKSISKIIGHNRLYWITMDYFCKNENIIDFVVWISYL